MKGVYLDYAASAPLRPEAKKVMREAEEIFGNPGSLHSFGQEAQALLDSAREKLAALLGADFRDVVFTGSATEANNLIIRGILNKPNAPQRIIISAVEHDSIWETAQKMKERGAEVEIVPVAETGEILEAELEKLLIKPAALVSIIAGQNEIGTIQDLRKISEMVKAARGGGDYPLFHTDAVQAFPHINIEEIKTADAVTLSAHKLGGPKGIGALLIEEEKRKKFLEPETVGGGQEFGVRAGTEDPARAAGFAAAAAAAGAEREERQKKLTELKAEMIAGLRKIFPDLKINGRPDLPHILNIHLPHRLAEDFLVALDMAGVAASAGAACSARAQKPSRVLMASGLSEAEARESLRFSLGWASEGEDVKKLIQECSKLVS